MEEWISFEDPVLAWDFGCRDLEHSAFTLIRFGVVK